MIEPEVLIVDDSLTVRMDLADAFTQSGFRARLCSTGEDAWSALQESTPNLVVLDVVLPDADGVELLGRIREVPALEAIPVVLLSEEAQVADRVRGLKKGANEYIGKPYDARYVVGRAAMLLRHSPVGGAERPTILVIDDSQTYREALAEALRDAGYAPVLVASGEAGLRRAAELHPHAIVVDGVMPEMDGTAVVRRLRLDPGLHATPCLLLTASEGAASEVVALDAGADAYVRKTESTEVVLARIAAVLRTAASSRERVRSASVLGPKRVLAIDDSTTYRETLAGQLRREGYEVVQARSGEEGLELLAIERVDCILLDLVMPGLSGTETCRRIKTSPLARNIPLVMLTSRDDDAAMVEGINAGADDYVAKSMDFDVLKARMRAQLRRKQFEDENRMVRDELFQKEAEAKAARRVAEERQKLLSELSEKNAALEYHVRELERLNQEMETFAYSVSHDLRQPLRGMDGFSQVLLDRYGTALDAQGHHYLSRIRAGAQRMGELIDGLLRLSRVSRTPLARRSVRLDLLADRILHRLKEADPMRSVQTDVQPNLLVEADPSLMESVLENLLGNAWKFTSGCSPAVIVVGVQRDRSERVHYVRDNGAGFDMEYADKLFGPFQRLHSAKEFDGTGIGLATVQRIIHRHGGRVWADSKVGEGTTFFFSMPEDNDDNSPEVSHDSEPEVNDDRA